MVDFILFSAILSVMVFIWSFVYLNRSHDQVNQSFLWFISIIILWMVLSVSNDYGDRSPLGLILKTVYWYTMLNMSLFFLYFVYRLVRRKLDALFYIAIGLNTATLFSRYLFPIDYSDPTFWRLSTPIVAPIMSFLFSLPAIYALYLVLQKRIVTQDARQKKQLNFVFGGINLALVISVISEYLLPTVFHVSTRLSLMFYAILVFVIAVFISIMKYRLFNVQSDYIFRKLFLNSSDATIIIGPNLRIVSVNNAARKVFHDSEMDSGDRITDYIKVYDYCIDYERHEVTVSIDGEDRSLFVTQYPLNDEEEASAKLLTIMDITDFKQSQKQEKDALLVKSYIDQPTGLYNRQYLMDHYCGDTLCHPSERFALLFIDMDDFKTINDRYGHLNGDEVLRAIAACIQGALRANTDVVRYGGDEFVVMLPDSNIQDACSVAERIRQNVRELSFVSIDSELRVTLSIGVVEGHAPITQLILEADRAMYSSKSRGKNAITVSGTCQAGGQYHMKL